MEKVYGIILAGGSGKRLWPLSRYNIPKQLITFGHSSLLAQTLKRLHDIPFITDIAIVTTKHYETRITQSIDRPINLILEPCTKNTAAALLLACLTIEKEQGNATLLFCPADHIIGNQHYFSSTICAALNYALNNEKLVLIGVPPTHPSTAYGYITYAWSASLPDDIGTVVSFHEKPCQEEAEEYSTLQNVLWNCGIFCAQVSVFINLFKRHMPTLYTHVSEGCYEKIEPLSFDKGVVEKVDDAVVVQGHFSWTDVGTLQHFIDKTATGSTNSTVMLECTNVSAYAEDKLIVAYGVENLCIIETHDTIAVINKDVVNTMDRVVDHLYKKGYNEYL